MPRNEFWGFNKLRSILELLRRNRSLTGNASPGPFPATAVSKVDQGYSIQQGLRYLSVNSKPWTKLDTKMVNSGKEKAQQLQPAATPTRLGIGQWVKWILGSILALILPLWTQNWGKLKRIEREAEMVVEEVEKVAEVVERVATVAEKVSEDVADELPDNTKLKEKVLLAEHVFEVAAKDAKQAEDFIHKVETLKHDLEDLETIAESIVDNNNHKIGK
ncbi:hypothetical protein EV1_034049 [Malus domestica]